MHVYVKNFIDNPFQTRGVVEANVKAIMKSIESTEAGFWDNVMGCPVDGVVPVVEGLSKEEQLKATKDTQFYIVYGHQRFEALRRLKIKTIDIPIKALSERDLLTIVCNENLETFGATLITNIGSVEQVYNRIKEQLDDASTWDQYQKKGFDMLTKKAQFDNAKKQGIGYKIIASVLDTWPINTIRAAKTAVLAINDGYFTKEEIQDFSSMDTVNRFSVFARKLYDSTDYPEAYLDGILAKCITLITNQRISGKTIDLATRGLEQDYDPVKYLATQAPTSMSKLFEKHIRNMIREGVEMYPDISPEVVEKCKKDIEKQAADEAKRAKAEADAKAGGEGDDSGDSGDTGDDSGELFGGDAPGEGAGEASDSLPMSYVQLGVTFGSIPSIIEQVLPDVADQVNANEDIAASVSEGFEAVVTLYATAFGFKELRKQVNNIQKKLK